MSEREKAAAGRSAVAAAVQKVATIVVGKQRPGPARSGRDPLNDLLVEMYVARRRKVDPLYADEAARRDRPKILRAREGLELRGIRSGTWARYMDWIFDVFPRFADLPYAPANVIASDTMIDRFAAELGERPLDVRKAEKMLRAEGYGDVDAGIACSMVRQIIGEGGRVGKINPPRLAEAVEWLIPRIREVGYRDAE